MLFKEKIETEKRKRSELRLNRGGRFRKLFAVKPLAVGISVVLLSACGEDPIDATIYRSVDECADDNMNFEQDCSFAYQDAVAEAQRTAPRFSNERDCEYEFGNNQCEYVENRNGSFFMPFMAGFMLSRFLNDGMGLKNKKRYFSQPLFTSYSNRSSLRGKWFSADGKSYGGVHKRNVRVYGSDFRPKPTASKTLKRGGFGRTIASRSSGSRSFGG